MGLAEQSPRVLAGCVIALVHAGALYGLLLLEPPRSMALSEPPVDVRFLAAPQTPPPAWRPRRVQITPPEVLTVQPELPLILAEPATDRAITAPVRAVAVLKSENDFYIPKLVSAVEYVREPAPRYPPQSRRLREQGVVVLRVVIDERGRACDIEIERSSGFQRLDHAAREAVASAAFRPYVEDGSPRRAQVLIPIEFSLSRNSA